MNLHSLCGLKVLTFTRVGDPSKSLEGREDGGGLITPEDRNGGGTSVKRGEALGDARRRGSNSVKIWEVTERGEQSMVFQYRFPGPVRVDCTVPTFL